MLVVIILSLLDIWERGTRMKRRAFGSADLNGLLKFYPKNPCNPRPDKLLAYRTLNRYYFFL